jgi:hypothetical protein
LNGLNLKKDFRVVDHHRQGLPVDRGSKVLDADLNICPAGDLGARLAPGSLSGFEGVAAGAGFPAWALIRSRSLRMTGATASNGALALSPSHPPEVPC